MERLQSYDEFWPFYVSQHAVATNRVLHFVGTSLALAIPIAALISGAPQLLLLAPVAGYGPAWAGHFFFEKNRPATFKYPLWSLRADFRMYRLTWLGRMAQELERASRLYPTTAQPAAVSEEASAL